ncbi:hypothetical protein L596_006849 [Steinernema carpocapsae]|uniref:Uncharacterized protein n=1 Tax=Steinernema carpocapsae TaxID=34508 RepID=A0A4U5P722_STECR|nr:hypothetical protein L596_006849 [Steinernema carpocapsae]
MWPLVCIGSSSPKGIGAQRNDDDGSRGLGMRPSSLTTPSPFHPPSPFSGLSFFVISVVQGRRRRRPSGGEIIRAKSAARGVSIALFASI